MATAALHQDVTVGTFEAAGFAPLDFDYFHRRELPRRLRDGGNESVAWDVSGAPSFAVKLPGGSAYSYVPRGNRVEIVPGIVADAELAIELNLGAWTDYVYGFRTKAGLFYAQSVNFLRGNFDSWDVWEPAIRCLYTGRPIYDPARLDLRDTKGAPLDLRRCFDIDDDPVEMSHFLRSTGYLVVKRAFSDRLGQLSDEVNRLRDAAKEDEVWSWWASDQRGKRFPYRLLYMGLRSQLIASLDQDPVVSRLRALTQENVVPVPDRVEGHLAVLKEFDPAAEVTGFANLLWHEDCGFGGCFLTCPCAQVGVQLDAANQQSSQLWMLAGSWGKTAHPPRADQLSDLPAVALQTEAGDATVHMGCGLHAGPGPTGPNPRRTLYIPSYNPRLYDFIGPLQGYQQVIPGWGNGAVPNPDEIQQRLY